MSLPPKNGCAAAVLLLSIIGIVTLSEANLYEDEDYSSAATDDATTATTPSSDPSQVPTKPKPACTGQVVRDIDFIRSKLDEYNVTFAQWYSAVSNAYWNWESDISDANQALADAVAKQLSEALKVAWKEVACFDCDAAGCTEAERRRLDTYLTIGTSALPSNSLSDLLYISSVMSGTYSTATLCSPAEPSRCLPLDPDLTDLLTKSSDYCTLQWAWQGWRNVSGRTYRGYYGTDVYLQNEAAKINGFRNAKEMWTYPFWYDDATFFDQMERAIEQLKPLYEQLHGYVKRKLMDKYGADMFPSSGHIPAHLLGNMWSQDWTNIFDLVLPYPDSPAVDITKYLQQQGYTAMDMVRKAESFFVSIGLDPMTNTFWNKSIFIKPEGANMVTHPSAWDFSGWDDFRIKMNTVINGDNFYTIHHEMGHIQYYMQYRNQPIEFRNGANPGFHEAIGDLIALSARSLTHLKAIGILPPDFSEQDESVINAQLLTALDKVAFIPFGYLVDKYRWSVFDQSVPLSKLNSAWWKLRCSLQGISPPVARSENDFDPGAKFHVAADVPYMIYFYALLAQFQFHEGLCRRIGWTKDFHKCDIYDHPDGASVLREALALGASRPYPEVLEMLTGKSEIDSEAILNFFEPLYEWLQEENSGFNVTWQSECPTEIPDAKCDYNEIKLPPPSPSGSQRLRKRSYALDQRHLSVDEIDQFAINNHFRAKI